MSFPATRLRRLRRTNALRGLVRETDLSVGHLVYPLFVTHGSDRREPIASMPGIERLTISHLADEAGEIAALGIPAVLLFGIPADKDEAASGAYDSEGIVQLAVRALKQAQPELTVITDVCLCEYMSHGHCGVVREDGEVDNDVTLELLAQDRDLARGRGRRRGRALRHDGRARRRDPRPARPRGPLLGLPIVAYSAKFASAFYGPFREAAESAPAFGDRRGYQMDPANAREAVREAKIDVAEGADVVMVKPALPYLDVIRAGARGGRRSRSRPTTCRASTRLSRPRPRRAGSTSARSVMESLTAIRRAGADMIVTYHAKEAARWLQA